MGFPVFHNHSLSESCMQWTVPGFVTDNNMPFLLLDRDVVSVYFRAATFDSNSSVGLTLI
jgi:hypothetical protein